MGQGCLPVGLHYRDRMGAILIEGLSESLLVFRRSPWQVESFFQVDPYKVEACQTRVHVKPGNSMA